MVVLVVLLHVHVTVAWCGWTRRLNPCPVRVCESKLCLSEKPRSMGSSSGFGVLYVNLGRWQRALSVSTRVETLPGGDGQLGENPDRGRSKACPGIRLREVLRKGSNCGGRITGRMSSQRHFKIVVLLKHDLRLAIEAICIHAKGLHQSPQAISLSQGHLAILAARRWLLGLSRSDSYFQHCALHAWQSPESGGHRGISQRGDCATSVGQDMHTLRVGVGRFGQRCDFCILRDVSCSMQSGDWCAVLVPQMPRHHALGKSRTHCKSDRSPVEVDCLSNLHGPRNPQSMRKSL